jgi:hypothetical protein
MSDDELLFLLDSDIRFIKIRGSDLEKDREEYEKAFKGWLEVQA